MRQPPTECRYKNCSALLAKRDDDGVSGQEVQSLHRLPPGFRSRILT